MKIGTSREPTQRERLRRILGDNGGFDAPFIGAIRQSLRQLVDIAQNNRSVGGRGDGTIDPETWTLARDFVNGLENLRQIEHKLRQRLNEEKR